MGNYARQTLFHLYWYQSTSAIWPWLNSKYSHITIETILEDIINIRPLHATAVLGQQGYMYHPAGLKHITWPAEWQHQGAVSNRHKMDRPGYLTSDRTHA